MGMRRDIGSVVWSNVAWHAYLVDGVYALVASSVFGLFVALVEFVANHWVAPLNVAPNDLLICMETAVAFTCVGFFVAVPFGMLGGSLIRKILRRRWPYGSPSPRDAARLGALVGALIGVLLDLSFVIPIVAASGIKFLPSYGYSAHAGNWSSHTIQFVTMLLWSLLTLLITTVSGAIRAKHLAQS